MLMYTFLLASIYFISISLATPDTTASIRWLQQFVPDPTAPYDRPSVTLRDLNPNDPSYKYTSNGDMVKMAREQARYLAMHKLRKERARLLAHALPPFILPSLASSLELQQADEDGDAGEASTSTGTCSGSTSAPTGAGVGDGVSAQQVDCAGNIPETPANGIVDRLSPGKRSGMATFSTAAKRSLRKKTFGKSFLPLSLSGPKLPLPREIHPVFVTPEAHPEFFTSTEHDNPENQKIPDSSRSTFRSLSSTSPSPNRNTKSDPSVDPLALFHTSPSSLIAQSRGIFARALTLPHSAAYVHDSRQFESLAASVGVRLSDIDDIIIRQVQRQWGSNGNKGEKDGKDQQGDDETGEDEEYELNQKNLRTRVLKVLGHIAVEESDDVMLSIAETLSSEKINPEENVSENEKSEDSLIPALLSKEDVKLLADVLHVPVTMTTSTDNQSNNRERRHNSRNRNRLLNRVTSYLSSPSSSASTSTSASPSSTSAVASPVLASLEALYTTTDTPECEQCRLEYTIQAQEIKKQGPDYLKSVFLPFCAKLWPSIAPHVGMNLCDPLIPGECEYICRGIVLSWASSVADVLSIALSDPGYHCYYTKAVCPRDTSHDFPIFPGTIVKSAGKPKKSGILKILQLSDIHLDEGYEEGERAECNMPLCCRRENYTSLFEQEIPERKVTKKDVFPNPYTYTTAPLSSVSTSTHTVVAPSNHVATNITPDTDRTMMAVIGEWMQSVLSRITTPLGIRDLPHLFPIPKADSDSANGNGGASAVAGEDNAVLAREIVSSLLHHPADIPASTVATPPQHSTVSSAPTATTFTNVDGNNDKAALDARTRMMRELQASTRHVHTHSHSHHHQHQQLKHPQQQHAYTTFATHASPSTASASTSAPRAPVFGPTTQHGARHFGEFACDSPMALVESVVKEIPKHDVQHVVFTGDAPAHDLWVQTKQANLKLVFTVTNMTLAQLNPGTRYWPVLGNHAAAPVNQFGGPGQDAWINGPLSEQWGVFLDKDAQTTLAWGGYYTAVMDAGLHVVALQTNYYDDANLFLKWGVEHWDLSGQLHWMESVLQQIQDLGEKAIILCHEKPKSFTNGVWAIKFQSILEKFAGTIVATFAGHNHNDMTHIVHTRKSFMPTFRGNYQIPDHLLQEPWLKREEDAVARERAGRDGSIRTAEPILVEYLSSSVTPVDHSTNPCYRVYTLDAASLDINDYDQYFLDLEKANKIGGAHWEKAYSAKSEYNLPDLSPASWHNFAFQMLKNNTLYTRYIQHYSAGYEPGFARYTPSQAACSVLTHLEDEMGVCLATLPAAAEK